MNNNKKNNEFDYLSNIQYKGSLPDITNFLIGEVIKLNAKVETLQIFVLTKLISPENTESFTKKLNDMSIESAHKYYSKFFSQFG